MKTTMIQIKKETAVMLKECKTYERQTYDEIIKSLLAERQHDILSANEKKEIEGALLEVKAGKVHSIEDVSKEFGVKL